MADSQFIIKGAEDTLLRIRCNYPAPLVVNGAIFCGCELDKGHEGQHKITITWGLKEDK